MSTSIPAFKFTDAQLQQIIAEGMVYMCACPAQLAKKLLMIRELITYQQNCSANPNNNVIVHQKIAEAALEAHQIMEQCMDDVLRLEDWDRETLTMPEGLRQRQLREI